MSNLRIFCSHALWSIVLPLSSVLYALKHYVPEWQVVSHATNIISTHLGSLDTKILYLELFQKFFSHPSVSLSSFINLVAKVNIFIKLIMYVLSHGRLLNLYKALFHLHTWLCMSCDFTSSGCKCLFVVYALYPTMFPSIAWWNYRLSFMYWYHILDIILLELVFPFFLVTFS